MLPALRQTGHYEMQKQRTTKKAHTESLSAVNNAVKILTPMLAAAGCGSKIQLLDQGASGWGSAYPICRTISFGLSLNL